MNEKTKEFRTNVTELFIKSLEEKQKNWNRPWAISEQMNAATNYTYRGINQIYLSLICQQREYSDPRWATFLQAQEKGWKIKRGAKGEKIEYWFPYDAVQKKSLTWQEYKDYDDVMKKNVVIRPVYKWVFNAADIIGIPERSVPSGTPINSIDLVERLSAGLRVPILYDGFNQAYYSITQDSIHLPEMQSFRSNTAYAATALHELAHSSGAAHRLNRPFGFHRNDPGYAREELVAEISSAYMSANLRLPYDESQMENHQAYVQSWIADLKEKPETLTTAIKTAEYTADYLEYSAGVISREEYQHRTMDVSMQTAAHLIGEIQNNGYPVSHTVRSMVKSLTEAVPGIHSLKDLHHAYKNKDLLEKFSPEKKKNILELGNALRNLELSKNYIPEQE